MEENKKRKHRYILASFVILAFLLRLWNFIRDPPTTNPENFWLATALELTLIILVYVIAKKVANNVEAGLFSALLATTIPYYNWRVAAQVTHTLAVFMFFLTVLCFIYLKELKDWRKVIIVPLVFAFIHVYALFLIPVLLVYVLFIKLERKDFNKNEIIFAIVVSLATLGIFAFFTATPAFLLIVKQYVSMRYYTTAAENFTLTRAFALAGLVPIYLGAFGAYQGLMKRRKPAIFLSSIAAVFLLFMAFNIIAIKLGLPYFSIALVCLASFFYKGLQDWVLASKLKNYEQIIRIASFVSVFIIGLGHWIYSTM